MKSKANGLMYPDRMAPPEIVVGQICVILREYNIYERALSSSI